MNRLLVCIAFLVMAYPGLAQRSWQKESEELVFAAVPFKACHASSLVERAPGELMVAFFAGTHEGHKDVAIWSATKKGRHWTQPEPVADGIIHDSLRFPCWNPVLFKARERRLFLFYKVGPNPREWWGMVRTSDDNGKTWTRPRKLPDGILGPIKNKPVQLADGTILSPSSVETDQTWKAHIERSRDQGKTWEKIPIDTGSSFRVIQPSILQYGNKRLQVVCRSDQDRVVYAWSEDNGSTWSALAKLALPNPNSGTDAVTLNDGTQLLVYNPTVRGKDWFNNRGKLNVAISKDGITWKDVVILENGGEEEYSYPAVIQTRDGKVHITYTYNRKNIKHVVLAQSK